MKIIEFHCPKMTREFLLQSLPDNKNIANALEILDDDCSEARKIKRLILNQIAHYNMLRGHIFGKIVFEDGSFKYGDELNDNELEELERFNESDIPPTL